MTAAADVIIIGGGLHGCATEASFSHGSVFQTTPVTKTMVPQFH